MSEPKKPLIGITLESRFDPSNDRSRGSLELNWNYPEVISELGGVPLLIPPTAAPEVVSQLIDGWLIPGGYDIDPVRYGQPLHPEAELQDDSRFEIEAALYRLAPAELPIFGVCYGSQFLNVIEGGTLNQHIPDLPGTEVHTGGTLQQYFVLPETQLHALVGTDTLQGKSYHHQSIGELGAHVRVSAKASDGVIEALEITNRRWTLAVQWHPERTVADPAMVKIFRGFIEAASAFQRGRARQTVGA